MIDSAQHISAFSALLAAQIGRASSAAQRQIKPFQPEHPPCFVENALIFN